MAKRRSNKRSPKKSVSRKSVKRGMKRSKAMRKSRKKKKSKKVLASTYGLANLMKVSEKGYKPQRVAKKDPYKNKHPPIPSNIKGKKKKKKSSSSKAAKDSFLAGIVSKSSKKGSWVEHVKAYWEERRKSEPGYKYKDAMKDAKKTW